MNGRTKVAIAVVAILIVAAGAGVWKYVIAKPPSYCQLSGRPIHPHMLTVVTVDGKKRYACCARCALTLAASTGKRVEIVEVTDYETGQRLEADKAWFVDGSRVAPCCAPAVRSEDERTPYIRIFDRCSPSLLAFAYKREALDFIQLNGGTLRRLTELMNALPRPGERK